jgi:hypothetical protein
VPGLAGRLVFGALPVQVARSSRTVVRSSAMVRRLALVLGGPTATVRP